MAQRWGLTSVTATSGAKRRPLALTASTPESKVSRPLATTARRPYSKATRREASSKKCADAKRARTEGQRLVAAGAEGACQETDEEHWQRHSGLHKASHTSGAMEVEVGKLGDKASCVPPNCFLIAAPTPCPCHAPTPQSDVATQTELTVDDIAKLESKQAKLKVENRRLKSNGYGRKYRAKKKELKRTIANASQEQAELKVEKNRRHAEGRGG